MHTGKKVNAEKGLYQVQTDSRGEKNGKDNKYKIHEVSNQGNFPYAFCFNVLNKCTPVSADKKDKIVFHKKEVDFPPEVKGVFFPQLTGVDCVFDRRKLFI